MISSPSDLEARRVRRGRKHGHGTMRPGISIVSASSPDGFDAARSILARQREWLEGILGGDLAAFQPSAVREYAEPERFYRPPDGRLLVGMVEGEAVGVVGVHRLGPKVAELKRMYVAPEARGLGIGRALAVAAIEAASDLGFETLRLETHDGHMPVAVKLYRELGFREAQPYHSVVGVEGLLTMELRLPAGTRMKRRRITASPRSDGPRSRLTVAA